MAGLLSGIHKGLFGTINAPDISQQLSNIQGNAATNRGISSNLYTSLQPGTSNFSSSSANITSAASDAAKKAAAGLQGTVANNTDMAKDALRKSLYGSTFSALPGTLQATREAAAAGGGVNSGAYNKAVAQVGQGTAQTLAQGEAGIQAQGAQAENAAATTAYQTVQNTLNNLTQDQLDTLNTAFQSGRTDLITQAAQQMGINDQETQAILDLYNSQGSEQMAADAANQPLAPLTNALGSYLGAKAGKK